LPESLTVQEIPGQRWLAASADASLSARSCTSAIRRVGPNPHGATVGATATGDGLGAPAAGLAAATGLAATGDPAGAVATAVANDTDGPTPGLASGPPAGDAAIIGCAVAVGVGARGASTRVVRV
jgi:hypothetical protein